MTGLLGGPYGMTQASYDLGPAAAQRPDHPPPAHQHLPTSPPTGSASRSSTPNSTTASSRPLFAADQPQAPPELRAALHTLDRHIDQRSRPRPTAHRSLKLGSTV